MSEDQRFAAYRPKVLFFETDTLTEDLTLGGKITILLNVSTTGTDADWVVKLIDMNPQKFMPNIYKADKADFIKATQRVYHSVSNPSYPEVDVLR